MMQRIAHRLTVPAAFLAAFMLFALPSRPAVAQCETSVVASPLFTTMAQMMVQDLISFIVQERNFIYYKINKTAQHEIITRLREFDENIREGFTEWWGGYYLPALQEMTGQLHFAKIDQNRVLGSMLDAQLANEAAEATPARQAEARVLYEPTDTTCQVDSMALGTTKAYKMSRALAMGFGAEALPRRQNTKGTTSARGYAGDLQQNWDEFVEYFCDPSKGDVGCDEPALLAGKHADISGLLWGDKQTIDLGDESNRRVVNAALRYMITPLVPDNIPPSVVQGDAGIQGLLVRHAHQGRESAIYNVMGQMIATRAGGSGTNAQDMRVAAGISPENAATDASYQELMQVMGQERFYSQDYMVKLVMSPEQLVREQGAINAMRLQQMSNLYKRLEEMVFMEAAMYAGDLDAQMPSNETAPVPVRAP